MRRALRIASVLVLLTTLGTSLPAGATPGGSQAMRAPLSGELRAALSTAPPGERLRVIITLRDPATRAASPATVVPSLRRSSRAARTDLMATLAAAGRAGLSGRATPLWIANAVSVRATPGVIRSFARRPDVAAVRPDAVSVVPAATTAEVNIATAEAPTLWNQGIDGSGVVVASLDSGVDASHPDLAGSFRGTPGSWFDPYGQHTTSPIDLTGHGTGTVGVMVGGDSGGTAIGMAPGARLDRGAYLERRGFQLPHRDPSGVPVGARPRRRSRPPRTLPTS